MNHSLLVKVDENTTTFHKNWQKGWYRVDADNPHILREILE